MRNLLSMTFIVNVSYFCMDKDFWGGSYDHEGVARRGPRKGSVCLCKATKKKKEGMYTERHCTCYDEGVVREFFCLGGSQAVPARPSGKERLVTI
jgi:hypothetical protein